MKGHANVLVSSAGTASAVSVIKALRRQDEFDVRIVATDVDPLAPGLHLADTGHLTPRISDSTFVDVLLETIHSESIDVYFPIFSLELEVVASNLARVEAAGARMMIPSLDAIRTANDKVAMASVLARTGVTTPAMVAVESRSLDDLDFPVFLKPRRSSSSKGARRIDDSESLRMALKLDPDAVVQEYVAGVEFTIDLLFDADGSTCVVAPRQRIATRAGQSIKGITVSADRFMAPVKAVADAVGLTGPCNMQFIDTGRDLHFIEVNPRFAAGGLMLTVAAGANIPAMILRHLLTGEPIPKVETRAGLSMTRYWEEIFVES